MTLKVAIVGSGPSGFYAAEAMLREQADVRIDLIERLPSPFGLVRGGVAPDHQSTKAVSRAFERTAQAEAVRYFGLVEIGRDVSLAELRGLYDAVILAVGAPRDRRLGIPGEDKRGVLGSAAFVGWYNGHPDYRRVAPPLDDPRALVIGNGNVALDVARVLVKTPAEMAASDIAEAAGAAIAAAPLAEVAILGRRGPAEARFSAKELREMGELAAAVPLCDPAALDVPPAPDLPERERRRVEKVLEILRAFAARPPESSAKRVRFVFNARPVEVLGGDRVTGLRCERTRLEEGRVLGSGETFEVSCGLIVTAIGYRTLRLPGVPFEAERGRFANRDGRIAAGLYCVGWCKRGPVGVIGSNKADGDAVAAAIAGELAPSDKAGRPGLEALLAGRGVRWLSYADWQTIDAAERAAAPPGAPRRKFATVEEMLRLLDGGRAQAGEVRRGAVGVRRVSGAPISPAS